MNFKCKQLGCGKLFGDEKLILQHFKIDHKMKQETHEFPCIINNDCTKQYLLLKSVKNHAKTCIVANKYVLREKLVSLKFVIMFHIIIESL